MRRQPISNWESPQHQVTCALAASPSARVTRTHLNHPTVAIPHTPCLIHLNMAATFSATSFAHIAVSLTAQPEELGPEPRLRQELPAMGIAGSAASPVSHSRRIARNNPIPPYLHTKVIRNTSSDDRGGQRDTRGPWSLRTADLFAE